MSNTFNIKRNDTKPYLAVQIKSNTGSNVDISNGSVFFNLATSDNNYTIVFSGTCNITGSTTGECEYRWASGNTNRSGNYLGEFEVVYNDGAILTAPSDHSLYIKIFEDYA